MSRHGTAGIRLRWRLPDITGFPGHERRQRLTWSLLYLAFAALCFLIVVDVESTDVARILAAIVGVGLVLWQVREHAWRPTFIASP